MTFQGAEFSIEQLYSELKKEAEKEKVQTQGEYNSLVDSVVDEKVDYGFFSEDEDIEQIKRNLKSRWGGVEGSLDRVSRYLG